MEHSIFCGPHRYQFIRGGSIRWTHGWIGSLERLGARSRWFLLWYTEACSRDRNGKRKDHTGYRTRKPCGHVRQRADWWNVRGDDGCLLTDWWNVRGDDRC